MDILMYLGLALGALALLLLVWIICVLLSLALIRFNHWAARTERRMRNSARRTA